MTKLGVRVDPEKSRITVDGAEVAGPAEKAYLMLNKPPGYTSTRFDPHARHTVMELVPGYSNLFPVGRLDVDTSGLMILTNDGGLAHGLTHPSFEVEKTYVCEVRGEVGADSIRRLQQGVELEDGVTAPARARLVSFSRKDGLSRIEIAIHEGRKRQVRRMFAALGHRVVRLKRVRIGPLRLGRLKEGESRPLTGSEIAMLKRIAQRPGSGQE